MILDAAGRPLTRRIGFTGGLEVERKPKGEPRVSLIGFELALEDDEEDTSCQRKNGAV